MQEPIKEALIKDALTAYLTEPFTIQSIVEVDGEYIRDHESDPQEIPKDTYDWIERVWLVRLRRDQGMYVDSRYTESFYVATPVEHPVVLRG
jgi:hypothetical protein